MLFYFYPMANTSLRIGLIQFDIAWEDVEANILRVEKLVSASEKVDLLILPEMWSTGFSMRPDLIAEESSFGQALTWMKDCSQKLNAAIAGSIATREGGRYYNRWYCVHPEGHIDQYDKKHLFSYGKENDHYTAGTARIVVEVKGWKIMPIICYDLRFPVWCRNNAGYDLLLVAANWPAPRIHHWDVLLQARAVENQSYIAAVNRIGTDGNHLLYPGHSSVVDMNGHIIHEMKDREGIEIATLDKSRLTEFREHFRFLQDQDAFRI